MREEGSPEGSLSEQWSAAEGWTPPTEQDLDLWCCRLSCQKADWDLLDATETARARRIVVEPKREQFVAARAALRRILSRYVQMPAAEIPFAYEEHGKPVLAGRPDLSFNLSHSKAMALLGFTSLSRLGVDVEHMRSGRRYEGIAKRFFAATEHKALLQLGEADRQSGFYRFWTHKEAYLKAWGTGLSFPSNRFAIGFEEDGPARLLHTDMPQDDPEAWSFLHIPIDNQHVGAACWEGTGKTLRWFA